MRSIVLIGMMGSGKTTCAKRLASRLRRELVDTDAVIVRRTGRPISEIFAREGEAAFRDYESAVCRELAGRGDLIIATGGGLVLRPENVAALKENGVMVFLDRPAAQIFDGTSMRGRPLAQKGKADFLRTFAVREPVYRAAADAVIRDFSSVEATVSALLRALNEMEDVL